MRIAGLLKNDLVDGLGFCVSLWTQGCPHHCDGCHNPETWSFAGGIEVQINQLEREIDEALNANGVERNFSVLGGEPLCEENIEDVKYLVHKVRENNPDIKIFLWTGYTYEELMARNNPAIPLLLKDIDVLIDGKFDINNRDITLWLRGSPNQRVIDVQKTLLNREVCEYVNPYN